MILMEVRPLLRLCGWGLSEHGQAQLTVRDVNGNGVRIIMSQDEFDDLVGGRGFPA